MAVISQQRRRILANRLGDPTTSSSDSELPPSTHAAGRQLQGQQTWYYVGVSEAQHKSLSDQPTAVRHQITSCHVQAAPAGLPHLVWARERVFDDHAEVVRARDRHDSARARVATRPL